MKIWLYVERDRELDPVSYDVFTTKDKAIEARGEPDFYGELLELELDWRDKEEQMNREFLNLK